MYGAKQGHTLKNTVFFGLMWMWNQNACTSKLLFSTETKTSKVVFSRWDYRMVFMCSFSFPVPHVFPAPPALDLFLFWSGRKGPRPWAQAAQPISAPCDFSLGLALTFVPWESMSLGLPNLFFSHLIFFLNYFHWPLFKTDVTCSA